MLKNYINLKNQNDNSKTHSRLRTMMTLFPNMSKIILGFKKRFTPGFITHVQELVSSGTPPSPDHPASYELRKKTHNTRFYEK